MTARLDLSLPSSLKYSSDLLLAERAAKKFDLVNKPIEEEAPIV
jgi:hypothetical protein